MYTAIQVANWFRSAVDRESGDSITHLKLQKLVYYSQAWALAFYGRPLFEEEMQAWTHGPVAVSVWREFKDFGWNALPPADEVAEFAPEDEALLEDVLAAYGEHSATALEELTHSEDPWLRARANIPAEARSTAVIPKRHMAEFYRQRFEEVGE
jgi:uncharacterized phage-associated protein